MCKLLRPLIACWMLAAPLFAGALLVEIGNPAANTEAQAKHAVLVARITACHSPEKTVLSATAEGLLNGVRKSIPLKVIPFSTAGTFGVGRQWPSQGSWIVKIIATNPDYKNYATSALVPFENDHFEWGAIKHYSHAPTDAELAAVLGAQPNHMPTSLN